MCTRCGSWLERRLGPLVVHAGCSAAAFARARQRVVPQARGRVVEVGFGSGLNLPFYDPAQVEHLIGIEPDATMLAIARRMPRPPGLRLDLVPARGEALPLADGSADTVVLSYTLCTIPDPGAALAEIRRILRPGGMLAFAEHGLAESPLRQRWQRHLSGLWGRLAGGCNLTRDPLALIRAAGFDVRDLHRDSFGAMLWPLGQHLSGIAATPAGKSA